MAYEKIEVHFHAETWGTMELDDGLKELTLNLAEDFKRYKESDGLQLPHYFGKDTPYMHPELAIDASLSHVHLAVPPHEFPAGRPQFQRKCPYSQKLDAALVYTEGDLYSNRFCLMAILWPNAHGVANDQTTISHLARKAKSWREEN